MSSNNTGAIIQARMGARRLPGKVLKRVLGKTLLEHEIMRVRRARTLKKIVIATTDSRKDDPIARLGKTLNLPVYRGSEDDVLDRFYQAAKQYEIGTIVRITGDCPLMDPAIVDRVVRHYLKNKKKFDYVSNVRPPTYPDGMDVEVFSFAALERAWKLATLTSEREHVTLYIGNHPEKFRIGNVFSSRDYSAIRLTVDDARDFAVIKKIFERLYPDNPGFSLADILRFLKNEPEIRAINETISRNEGLAHSLREDKLFTRKTRSTK